MRRADFERVGGYDEVYPCWGEEDNDLFDAFAFTGLQRRDFPGELVRHLEHDDATRTRYYPVREKVLGHAINRVYRILKWDVARLNGEWPRLETRKAIYEMAAREVTAFYDAGNANDLCVNLPSGIVPGGWTLTRSLNYRLIRNPRIER